MIGEIRGWAFGLLHLSRQDFYAMTQGEFWEAMDAYRREKDSDRRHMGELGRGLGVRLHNLLVSKPCKDVTKYWPMPWDEKNTAEDVAAELNAMSIEQRNALAQEFMEKTNGWTDSR